MAKKKQSRKTFTIGAVGLVLVGVVYAFWPKATLVDIGEVSRGSMTLTINEEARTRVRDTYTVSAPVSGRLLRVDAEPNDNVQQGQTVVARMLPSNPPTLDLREREQARTAVQAAEAALQLERATMKKAVAENTLATTKLDRATRLQATGVISQSDLEQFQQEAESAVAGVDNATAAILLRKAELANAQAARIVVDDSDQVSSDVIDIRAPINGRILQVLQESETIIAAGTPIVDIGDVEGDLEIIVELLSTDAVQVNEGDKAIIQNWGGPKSLLGVVARVDAFGFTKFSALGVEEQRVNAIVRFTNMDDRNAKLGHGFRVEIQVVIWEGIDTVIVPSSALFRDKDQWAVFVVEDATATLREVKIGHNNGIEASVIEGLESGDRVVLYPASELTDGARVANRQESR